MKRSTAAIAASVFLTTGLLAGSAIADEALETRKDVRESAGVEAGDRANARKEVVEASGADVSERAEARESAGVEAGDRAEARKNVREAVD